MKKLKLFLPILFLAVLVLTACTPAQATPAPAAAANSSGVVAEGHVTPRDDLKLAFSARAKVAEILVSEGQTVKKGDALVRQADSEQAQAALAAANLELTQAQQAYDEFNRTLGLSSAQALEAYQKAQEARAAAQLVWEAVDPNQVQDDIDTAQTDVQDKKKLRDDAKDTLDKYLDLKTDNPTRRKAEDDLRQAEANYNTALREVEKLQRSLDNPRAALDAALAAEAEAKRTYDNTLNAAPDPDKKAILEARLENAKAQAAAAENTLNNYSLKAPFDGTVTDVNVTVGELVGNEKFAIQMADFGAWYIETSDLTELEVVDVTVGQPVEIRPDAKPGLVLQGVVENIGQSSKTQGGDVLYIVKIKLLETDPALRWGMTVEATFTPLP
jgi:multidrug efflux pump subunit AcrA (membrane-fusion protein)